MGPKSYAVREAGRKANTKMKGFTIHHENANKVSLVSTKKLVDGDVNAITGNHLNFIKRRADVSMRESWSRRLFSRTPSSA